MLFPYTYVPHKMEKMQEFIDFIFNEVWCKAPTNGPFGLHLFNANSELDEVMTTFFYSDTKGAYFFYSNVERIYDLFLPLTANQINQLQLWYEGNNDLDKVCTNDSTTQLARYTHIGATHKNLSIQLKVFFTGLYDQNLLRIPTLREKIGDITDHYQNFVSNNEGKCPFCGISDMKGPNHRGREAYDHFLPKALYPFNSINFRNLVPTCHECNSAYKLSKDPAHNSNGRRKAFNPYSVLTYAIQIQISLRHADMEKLTPTDIMIEFGPTELIDELETWKDVYGIDERFKAKACWSGDGKYWLLQVMDECQRLGKTPVDILEMRTQQMHSLPYADCNFLRVPFLNACQLVEYFGTRPAAAPVQTANQFEHAHPSDTEIEDSLSD